MGSDSSGSSAGEGMGGKGMKMGKGGRGGAGVLSRYLNAKEQFDQPQQDEALASTQANEDSNKERTEVETNGDTILSHEGQRRSAERPFATNGSGVQLNGNGLKGKPLADDYSAAKLLSEIGFQRNWSDEDIDRDVRVMQDQRLYTLVDLRLLGPKAWREVPLLPIVKELLQRAAWQNFGRNTLKEKKKEERQKAAKLLYQAEEEYSSSSSNSESEMGKKKKTDKESKENAKATKKADKLEKKEAKRADKDLRKDGQNETIEAPIGSVIPEGISPESMSAFAAISAYLNGTASNVPNEPVPRKPEPLTNGVPQQPRFLSTPVVTGSKIKATASDGKTYEFDRWCPHKGVDLAKGPIVGTRIICPKHRWEFDLARGGVCVDKPGKSVNACVVNDW
ncbi:hypothetical protein BJ742DRAFT_805448 [Cladochytrium replicatum]|nr:hypothetical protein BJ742DRAFT_805448 [Cladochytrium replicatum]